MWSGPFVRGGEGLRRLYPDGRVPLSWRKYNHLVQELINTGQQVLSVLSLIRNVMKDLKRDGKGQGTEVWETPAKACSVSPGSELWCHVWGSMLEVLHSKNIAKYSCISGSIKQLHSRITPGALEKSCMLSIKYEGNAAAVHLLAGRSVALSRARTSPEAQQPPHTSAESTLKILVNTHLLHLPEFSSRFMLSTEKNHGMWSNVPNSQCEGKRWNFQPFIWISTKIEWVLCPLCIRLSGIPLIPSTLHLLIRNKLHEALMVRTCCVSSCYRRDSVYSEFQYQHSNTI